MAEKTRVPRVKNVDFNKGLNQVMKSILYFQNFFNKESDRALIIISQTMLDEQLKNIIKSVLVERADIDEKLFGQHDILDSFYSKIEMAYVLGVINQNHRQVLHIIRSIRNDCAHELEGCTLADVNDKINSMVDIMDLKTLPNIDLTNIRIQYLNIIANLFTKLTIRVRIAKRLVELTDGMEIE